MTDTIDLLREAARTAEKDAQAWQARATAAEALANEPCANCGFPTEDIIGKPKLTERLAAAEGERDALRAERDAPMGGYGVPSGPMREFYPRVIAKLEAEAAEARGREKALREERDYFKDSYSRKLDDEREALETASALYAEKDALRLVLEAAADTLRDAGAAYHFFGKHVAAEAMELAERHCRAALALPYSPQATTPALRAAGRLGGEVQAESRQAKGEVDEQ